MAALAPAASPAAGTLVHWYKADGDATDSVAGADASNGALLGDTAFGAGKLGQAFVVDGADDYVSIPPNASFYPSGSFTVDAWAATTTPVQQGTLVPGQIAVLYECANFCPSGVANAMWEIEIRDGRAFGNVRDDDSNGPGGNGQVITGGPLLNDGAFHRVTLVRDVEAHVLALYADGIEVAEAPLNAGADSALTSTDGENDPMTIGAQFEGGTSTPIEEFAGSIDEVRYLTGTDYPDTTPPVIAPVVSGTAGGDGWYTGDVSVTWAISDESITRSATGCGPTTLTSDTSAATLSCQATSAGGSSTGSVTVRRDATPPSVTCSAAPKFALGATGTVTASVADAGSGAASASVTTAAATQSSGAKTAPVTGRDIAGNTATRRVPVHGRGAEARDDLRRDHADRHASAAESLRQPAPFPDTPAQREGDEDRRRAGQARSQDRARGQGQGTRPADRPEGPTEGQVQGDDHRHRFSGRQARRCAHVPDVRAETEERSLTPRARTSSVTPRRRRAAARQRVDARADERLHLLERLRLATQARPAPCAARGRREVRRPCPSRQRASAGSMSGLLVRPALSAERRNATDRSSTRQRLCRRTSVTGPRVPVCSPPRSTTYALPRSPSERTRETSTLSGGSADAAASRSTSRHRATLP